MSNIYTVENQFRVVHGQHVYVPGLITCSVLKDSPKQYIVRRSDSTYTRTISKNNKNYSTCPIAAWDRFIERARVAVLSLQEQLVRESEVVRVAVREREELINTTFKVGGSTI